MAKVFGIDAGDLPDGVMVADCVVILRAMEPDGEPAIYIRRSEGLAVWDAIGLTTIALDTFRDNAQECFIPDDEDEEEVEEP